MSNNFHAPFDDVPFQDARGVIQHPTGDIFKSITGIANAGGAPDTDSGFLKLICTKPGGSPTQLEVYDDQGNSFVISDTTLLTWANVLSVGRLSGGTNPQLSAGDFLEFSRTNILTLDALSQSVGTGIAQIPDLAGTTDQFVMEDITQTLTNKTLTAPTISDFTNANHDHEDADDGGTLDINNATTGTLAIGQGGTGETGTPTNGQLLIGNGSGYTIAALTPTINQVGVANGAGTITLSTPQDIHTGATPTFASMLITAGGTIDLTAAGTLGIGQSAGANNITIGGATSTLVVPGNLTVQGTTTSIETTTLDVEDANVTINKGGNQAAADANDAGLTVEMSDATDALIHYDSTSTTKWKVGEVGAVADIADISTAQTLTNKTLTTPTISDFTNAQHDHSNAAAGGNIPFTSLTGADLEAVLGVGNVTGANDIQIDDGQVIIFEGATNDVSVDGLDQTVGNGVAQIPDLASATDQFVMEDVTQTMTNKTLTTPTIGDLTNATHDHSNAAGGGQFNPNNAFTTQLGEILGGTNQTTYTTGDVLYSSAANTLSKLGIGSAGDLLEVNTGVPAWTSTPIIGDHTNAQHDHQDAAGGGVLDHGLALAGSLIDDDHTQYALLAGRSGGQTLIGGTLTTNPLTLQDNAVDATQITWSNGLLDIGGTKTTPNVQTTGHLGVGRTATTGQVIVGEDFYTATGNVVGMGMFPASIPSVLAANNLYGVQGNVFFGGSNWGAVSNVNALQFYPAPDYLNGAASWGSSVLNLIGITTGGMINIFGRTVTADKLTGISTQCLAHIFGAPGAVTCNTATAIEILSSSATTGTWSLHTGLRIDPQIEGTVNQGIWMNGNAVGSDIVFGTGKSANIFYNGTNLIIDPNLSGSGIVLIGTTGDNDMRLTNIEIDGALNHDGSTVGFYGTAPTTQSAAYTPTNVTPDRAYDANVTTVNELADVLGTLIADLQLTGLIA